MLNCAGPQNNTSVHAIIHAHMWIPSKQNMTLMYPLSYAGKMKLRGLQNHFLICLYQEEITRHKNVSHVLFFDSSGFV